MSISFSRIATVARREFLTTVRRKAFLFTVVGTPAYFAFVMWISTAGEMGERSQVLKELSSVGVVDSSGLFAGAPLEIRTEIRPDQGNLFAKKAPEGVLPTASFQTRSGFLRPLISKSHSTPGPTWC